MEFLKECSKWYHIDVYLHDSIVWRKWWGNKQRVDEMLASSTSCSIHKRYWACEHYLAFHTKGPLQVFLSNWSFNLHLGKQPIEDIRKWDCALPVEEAAAVQNGNCPRGRNPLKNKLAGQRKLMTTATRICSSIVRWWLSWNEWFRSLKESPSKILAKGVLIECCKSAT